MSLSEQDTGILIKAYFKLVTKGVKSMFGTLAQFWEVFSNVMTQVLASLGITAEYLQEVWAKILEIAALFQ